MARLPYPDTHNPAIAPLVERIQRERGKMSNLYRMLLHSPPVAEGWLTFLTAIRQKCSLSGHDRELVILYIAVLNGADYEFRAHVPFALKEGITQTQIDALRDGQLQAFDARARDVLAYCQSMTREVNVPDALFQAIRQHLGEREVVELTATIGAYNLVSRLLQALRIDHD